MFCKNCGKELNDHAIFCPGCGTATKPATETKEEKSSVVSSMVYNVYAIIAFVCSFTNAIAGIVFGWLGYNFALKNNNNGKKMSVAAIVLSIVYVVCELTLYILRLCEVIY